MTWADGSRYFGMWQDGIQNGIGIMIFASGIKKAGIFKNNVLSELLLDQKTVKVCEEMFGSFSAEFKQHLNEYLFELNPTED